MMSATRDCRNIIGIRKNGETWLFFYDSEPSSEMALLGTLHRFASDEDLSFDWEDAVLALHRAEQLRNE